MHDLQKTVFNRFGITTNCANCSPFLTLYMRNNPFTPGFQRRLLAMLLQMPETYPRYNDVWDPTYFDEPKSP
jgi:hypothetical protein